MFTVIIKRLSRTYNILRFIPVKLFIYFAVLFWRWLTKLIFNTQKSECTLCLKNTEVTSAVFSVFPVLLASYLTTDECRIGVRNVYIVILGGPPQMSLQTFYRSVSAIPPGIFC